MTERVSENVIRPDSPIGVFDSGVGGLTVVKEILTQLPKERVLYFADTAHVPYGGRPLDEVKGFALEITRFLVSQGAKMVIMACNISSATALEEARKQHPDVMILGVVQPGARAAAKIAGNCRIGVLATEGTVRSGAYLREISKLRPSTEVIQQACPQYVPLIEAGKVDSPEAREATEEYVRVFKELKVETLILGCTHYPFMTPRLRESLSARVNLVDPAIETVREAAELLSQRNLLSVRLEPPSHEFYASGSAQQFEESGSRFLGCPLGKVRHQLLEPEIKMISG